MNEDYTKQMEIILYTYTEEIAGHFLPTEPKITF